LRAFKATQHSSTFLITTRHEQAFNVLLGSVTTPPIEEERKRRSRTPGTTFNEQYPAGWLVDKWVLRETINELERTTASIPLLLIEDQASLTPLPESPRDQSPYSFPRQERENTERLRELSIQIQEQKNLQVPRYSKPSQYATTTREESVFRSHSPIPTIPSMSPSASVSSSTGGLGGAEASKITEEFLHLLIGNIPLRNPNEPNQDGYTGTPMTGAPSAKLRNAEEIGFFDLGHEAPESSTGIVTIGKHTMYTDVFIFTDKLRHMVKLHGEEPVRNL